jgi:hypothetical protein
LLTKRLQITFNYLKAIIMKANKNEEVFNPDKMDCCIEIGNCELQNPPKELIEKTYLQTYKLLRKNNQRFS